MNNKLNICAGNCRFTLVINIERYEGNGTDKFLGATIIIFIVIPSNIKFYFPHFQFLCFNPVRLNKFINIGYEVLELVIVCQRSDQQTLTWLIRLEWISTRTLILSQISRGMKNERSTKLPLVLRL